MDRMSSNPGPDAPKPVQANAAKAREDRLKAALKANMARRKAQARARSVPGDDGDPTNTNEK